MNHQSALSLGIITGFLGFSWTIFRLSLSGMTVRHLICGYSIRKVTDLSPFGPVSLFVREFLVTILGLFTTLKIMLPAIFKNGLNTQSDLGPFFGAFETSRLRNLS